VYFSGNANNGAKDGFVYANSNNAPSNANANIGSHLCYNVRIRPDISSGAMTVPLGKKVQANPKGVGRDAIRIGYRRLRIRKAE